MDSRIYEILINENLEITDNNEYGVVQNSIYTQYLQITPDGWTFPEGYVYYVSFSHEISDEETIELNPIYAPVMTDGSIRLKIPTDVSEYGGEWVYAVQQRYDFSTDDDGNETYRTLTSGNYILSLYDSIATASGKTITQSDLAEMVGQIMDTEAGLPAVASLASGLQSLTAYVGSTGDTAATTYANLITLSDATATYTMDTSSDNRTALSSDIISVTAGTTYFGYVKIHITDLTDYSVGLLYLNFLNSLSFVLTGDNAKTAGSGTSQPISNGEIELYGFFTPTSNGTVRAWLYANNENPDFSFNFTIEKLYLIATSDTGVIPIVQSCEQSDTLTVYASTVAERLSVLEETDAETDSLLAAALERVSALESDAAEMAQNIADLTPAETDDDFISEIRDAQTEKSLLFVWLSDTHFQQKTGNKFGVSKSFLKETAELSKDLNADFIAVTGDVVNGYYPLSDQKSYLYTFNNLLEQAGLPILYAFGNHDDNSWYASGQASDSTVSGLDEVLTPQTFYSYTLNNDVDKVIFDSDNPLSGWYYKNFSKSKIRVIVLNAIDIPYSETSDGALTYYGQWKYGFRESQLKWLCEKALKFRTTGWAVVIMAHIDYAVEDFTDNAITNAGIVEEILTAFQSNGAGTASGTTTDFEVSFDYDFSENQSNEVIASFAGHIHTDNIATENGIPHITILNAYASSGGGVDVVTIDRTSNTIFTRRYNGGALADYDRSIEYAGQTDEGKEAAAAAVLAAERKKTFYSQSNVVLYADENGDLWLDEIEE